MSGMISCMGARWWDGPWLDPKLIRIWLCVVGFLASSQYHRMEMMLGNQL